MAITFGGLSTGLDTNSIIDKLLEIEKQPIAKLNSQKTQLGAKLDAIKTFDGKLDTLLTKVDLLGTPLSLLSNKATASSGSYIIAQATSTATPGTYEIKVGRLAQVEKAVFNGVADKSTTTFGAGSLVINNDALSSPVTIAITTGNNTLEGIRDAINSQGDALGVSASIVNDGGSAPYRLVLTGKSVSNANITIDASGLTGGVELPGKDNAVSRLAQKALVQVDGITVTSDTNTLSEAIPGVTLNLTHADPAFNPTTPNWSAVASTTLDVATDSDAISGKITDFVSAFNEVVKAAGTQNLASDNGIRSILSALRSKFTDSVGGTGLFALGIKTQKDGSLLLDSIKLNVAVKDNLAGVQSLLAGSGSVDGIADKLKASLAGFTNATSGFLAGRQKGYDNSIRRIDNEIARNESRVANVEKELIAKFSAMENLVSSLNSQGNYLTQQMNALNGGNK